MRPTSVEYQSTSEEDDCVHMWSGEDETVETMKRWRTRMKRDGQDGRGRVDKGSEGAGTERNERFDTK
jgi:hypothetical protein